MKRVGTIAFILAIIGSINWGVVGFFNFDLIGFLLGGSNGTSGLIPRIIYSLVGLSGLVLLYNSLTRKR